MLIKTKLNEADFIKANFALLYRKTSTKIYIVLAIADFAYNMYYDALSLGMEGIAATVLPPLLLILFPPALTWFVAKRNFASAKRASETIEYRFDKDDLFVKGESFSSQLSWDKIYRVTQTKDFILIWQTRASANFIPKKDIWEGDIIELKEILESHKVKNTL